MSEVESLLALYGALDGAVAAGEVDPATISPLLGAYAYEEAIGWYANQYLPWVEGAAARAERRGLRPRPEVDRLERKPRKFFRHRADAPSELATSSDAPVERPILPPHAQDVHDALTAFGSVPLQERTAARRLLAVTVVARAMPQFFGPNGSHADVASSTLAFRIQGEDADDDAVARRAQRLHEQLVDQFTDMDQWRSVVRNAVEAGMLPLSFQSQEDAPPCAGRLIMRPTSPGGDPDPCLVMEAEFTTKSVTFEEAKVYLQPTNWQYEGSLWCLMKTYDSRPPNSWLYNETVSTDCGSTSPAWTVSTKLQFWFSHPTPNEARVEYDFAHPPVVGSDIEIDEGSLRIMKLADNSVHVKTTKRVRFAGNFDGPGLAMFMCASGYSTILQDTVLSVARSKNPDPFPIPAPQGGTMSPPQDFSTTSSSSAPTSDTLDSLISEGTAFAEAQVKDLTATCTSSLAKVQDGTYTVESAWADGLKLWASGLAGLGKAFDLGTRAAKVVIKEPDDGK
jgi:hypothetical protein